MKYSTVDGIETKLSQITLGTWVFSGDTWGGTDEHESLEAVHAALDSGINVIDTAPVYGFGRAETIVGKALRGKRDRVFLATKCGLRWQGKQIRVCLTPESIREEITDSLKRLQTDYVDLYQCHWPDPKTPLEETWGCLQDLAQEGKIRHIGVSNFPLDLLKQTAAFKPPACFLQSPLSLLDRGLTSEILPFCAQNTVGVLAYGPLAGGILSGKYTEPRPFAKDDARSFFYKHYTGDQFKRVRRFLDKAESLGRPLNQIAVNWIRRQNGVVSVLTGCRNPAQAAANAAALNWDMSDEDVTFLNTALTECGL